MVETKSVTIRESTTRNRAWKQFFPNSYRRDFAKQFVEVASGLAHVREIVAVSYPRATPESNFFIVIVSDSILDEDHALGDCDSKVFEEWENALSNGNKGVLINPPIVRTESDFEGFVSESSFKRCKIGTVWSASTPSYPIV